MNVLIIEDENAAVQRLISLLYEIESGIQIMEVLESVENATNWLIQNPPPDLIFMDIKLEDGICFEIPDKALPNTPVIFTTVFEEFALKTFHVNNITYLLKPVNKESLQDIFKKYHEISGKQMDIDFKSLLNQFLPRNKDRFLIKAEDQYKSIQVHDIACFFNQEHRNFINTFHGNSYDIDFSLDKVEHIVCPGTFFRVNKNLIINYLAIKDVVPFSSGRLKIIIDGLAENEIIVSHSKIAEFKTWMDK